MMNIAHIQSNIERQQHLMHIIETCGRIKVAQIAEEFQVSEATARRDLETLADQGLIQRVHGGALSIQPVPSEQTVLKRMSENHQEKARIGRATADLVKDGETVFLGSGTTVQEVARHLINRNITVITNSLPVIDLLAQFPNISLIALGGILRMSELSFIGHITEQALQELRADKVIMGTRSVSLEHGFMNDYLPEIQTDRAILTIGREVVVVADWTKWGTVATAFFAPLTSAQTLVTDDAVSPHMLEAVRAQGIAVVVA